MSVIIIILLIALAFALYEHFDSRNWQKVTSPIRNNIVFGERNKKYGAYAIRRDYNDLILIILIILFVLVGIFKIVNSSFIDKTYVAVVPKYDTVEIKLEAPPMQEIKTVKTPYKIVGGGGGSGTPSSAEFDPKPKPMSNAGRIPAASKDKPKQGNKPTGGDSKATSKNPKPNNPFGSDGSGGGNTGGNGRGMGQDDGDGNGKGQGPGDDGGKGGTVKRVLVKRPNTSNINNDQECKIVFRVTINANGDVISATNMADKSTTTNSSLISQVKSLVLAQAKYNKAPGAKDFVTALTLTIKPQ